MGSTILGNKPDALFKCQECGHKFKTLAAAQRADNDGCPGCGGCDIDVNY